MAPRNGSGTMSIPYSDFVSNTTISSAQIDDNFATIVAELTNSMPRDGQAAPTANLPMGSFKFTGLGSGSAATDSANLGQIAANAYVWCGTAGGTANALTLTPTPAHTAYAAGKVFRFIAASSNTGATTVNVSAIGVKTIQNNGVALAAGVIVSGKIYEIIYDGTQFQLMHYFAVDARYKASFAAYASSTQSIPNNTDTLIAYDTEISDPSAAYTNTAANYKFTAPIAGTYEFTAFVTSPLTSGANYVIRMYKNGALNTQFGVNATLVAGNFPMISTVHIALAATDYVQAYFFQDSGSSQTITAGQFHGKFVSP